MPNNKRKTNKPRRHGSVKADVAIQSTASRSFLATIEGDRRPGDDRIVGTNGIVWNVGKVAL